MKINLISLIVGVPLILFAHVEEPQVVAGHAEFNQISPTHLEITTQNATIIDCKSFNIPENHTVKIVQPNAKSRMLTRVKGSQPSEIFGRLESVGKVFLINPNGIFFGPNCTVNTGALIASTLDIANDDFKKGRFRFQLSPEAKESQIINEGVLTASLEGVILLAPHIINKGVINAKAGRIAFLGAPIVTLDFTGDNLVSFAVEGELEQGIVKHLGKIASEEGDVYIRLSAAKKVIQTVVNTDGLTEGSGLLRENGIVRIASASEILARNVSLQGHNVEIAGKIDCASLDTNAQKTHLKTDIHAEDNIFFRGDTIVEDSKVVLTAGGKKGINFQDTLTLKEKLKMISPEGIISLGRVEGEKGVALDVTAKLIEVNQPIRLKSPVTFNGRTQLTNKITASQSNIIFNGPVILGGSEVILLTTGAGKGDVRFNGSVDSEGTYSELKISTGEGDVSFTFPIGKESPLALLDITAKSIDLQDVGGEKSGAAKMRVSADGPINMEGSVWNAGEQSWKGDRFYVYKPAQFISQAHSIEFVKGAIDLKEDASFHVNTQGGSFNFFAIQAPKKANISLTTGSVSLGEISAPASSLNIQAKDIIVKGNIIATPINMDAKEDIVSGLRSHKIVSKGDVTLNSREGSIGYKEKDADLSKSRLRIETDQKIYVGSSKTVNLEGISIDKILHPIPGNEPSFMIFNDMETYQYMGEFFEDLDELLSSLAPHLFSKKRGDYIDTTIVNPVPPLLYYKP